MSTHAMLAGLTKAHELALEPSEAKSLAQGIANVASHYDVQTSTKALDWTNLIMVCGMIYGTRIVAIRERRRNARPQNEAPRAAAPSRQPNNANVVEIPGVGMVSGIDQF